MHLNISQICSIMLETDTRIVLVQSQPIIQSGKIKIPKAFCINTWMSHLPASCAGTGSSDGVTLASVLTLKSGVI